MYSIRSAESWGVGDYGDLKLLLTDAAEKSHADFMLINPIHATAPVEPLEPSPYLPESRPIHERHLHSPAGYRGICGA